MVPGERAKRRVLHSITPRARLATTVVTAVLWLRYSVGLMRRNGVYAHTAHTHNHRWSCAIRKLLSLTVRCVLLFYFLE